MPSLFSFFPTLKPGVPFSRINAEIPCEDAARSVTAMATQTSATCALVVKVFPPFSTQQSPSRTACVRVPPASDPASGSVSDQQPIHSPRRELRNVALASAPGCRPDKYGSCRAKRAPRRSARSTDPRARSLPSGSNNRRSYSRSRPILPEKPRPARPSRPSSRNTSTGKCCDSSHSITCGRISASAEFANRFAQLMLFRRVAEIHAVNLDD